MAKPIIQQPPVRQKCANASAHFYTQVLSVRMRIVEIICTMPLFESNSKNIFSCSKARMHSRFVLVRVP